MPAAQPERHAGAASHVGRRTRIRFHRKRASEGTLHRDSDALARGGTRRLVVAAHPYLAPVVQAMRIAAPRMKSIVVAHGIEVWEPLSTLRRRALRRANLILTPTQDTADHIATQQQIPRDRIRVLPWALDPDFEALAAATSQSALPAKFPAGRVILTVGRWQANERYKGMDTLITALPRLLHEWTDLQLVAVGEGDDQAWLEQLAEGCGVRRHVHFFSGLTQFRTRRVLFGLRNFRVAEPRRGFRPRVSRSDGARQTGDRRRARRSAGSDRRRQDRLPGATRRRATACDLDRNAAGEPGVGARNGRARSRTRESRFQIQRVRKIAEKNLPRAMRILNVTQTYAPFLEFGGPPVKVRALSEALARRGHQVTVLTADWGLESRFPDGVEPRWNDAFAVRVAPR